MNKIVALGIFTALSFNINAQTADTTKLQNINNLKSDQLDPKELAVNPVKDTNELPLKIHHAEPLYIDLIRDLGARKGEKEFNVGFGVADKKTHYEYNGFIEYEFAVADRLGLEIEVPFSFNKATDGFTGSIPNNKIEGLKLATQYTFLVSEKYQTSLAIGYIHEFEFQSFKTMKHQNKVFEGMSLNPIFIAAKKWGDFHTLLYTGPVFEQSFESKNMKTSGLVNFSLHYVIPNTKHFLGLENNMEIHGDRFEYVLRPQFKISLQDNLAIGFMAGVPLKSQDMKMDCMTRVIWEPNF